MADQTQRLYTQRTLEGSASVAAELRLRGGETGRWEWRCDKAGGLGVSFGISFVADEPGSVEGGVHSHDGLGPGLGSGLGLESEVPIVHSHNGRSAEDSTAEKSTTGALGSGSGSGSGSGEGGTTDEATRGVYVASVNGVLRLVWTGEPPSRWRAAMRYASARLPRAALTYILARDEELEPEDT